MEPSSPRKLPLIWMSLFGISIGLVLILLPRGLRVVWAETTWEIMMVQVGSAVLVASTIMLVYDYVWQRYTEERQKDVINKPLERLNERIEIIGSHLDSLSRVSEVLQGAHQSQIEAIYHNRPDALETIMAEIERANNICICGISLRGFFLSGGAHYQRMGEVIRAVKHSTDRRLRVLLINPFSDQAVMRAERESKEGFSDTNPYEDSGLYSDVWQAIKYLVNELETGKMEAKVYSAAPSCFLLITDKTVFVEQYHYGLPMSGLVGGHVPVVQFAAGSEAGKHLVGHFEYVWEARGSVPIDKFVQEKNAGISNNAWDCGMVNLFPTRKHAEARVRYILQQAGGTMYLVGISLRDFLHAGRQYYESLHEVARRAISEGGQTQPTVRCLMLDPMSEQGRLRSEREEPGQYTGNLYKEVDTSINRVRGFKAQGGPIDARLYNGAPSAFIILTEQTVMVEQYHYGSGGSTILGGKVPLGEFSCKSSTYQELKGHVEYMWSDLSKPEEEWKPLQSEDSPKDNRMSPRNLRQKGRISEENKTASTERVAAKGEGGEAGGHISK